MSKAVPWSTDVRMIGRPRVTLTPLKRLPAASLTVDGEAKQLDRDMALVVIHGDHGVELLGAQFHEDSVAGHWPVDVVPLLAETLDGRFDDIDVLAAEQAAFAGMGIEGRDGDAAARNVKRLERLVGERDDAANPFRRHALRHVFERGVGGDVAHAHGAVNQQHHAVARPSEIGEQFRVTAIVMASEVERFLADRPRADGVSDAVEREAYGGRDRVIGYAPALRRRLAGRDGNTGRVDVEETDRGQIGARLRDGDRRRRIGQTQLLQRFPMRRARADQEKGKLFVRDPFAQGRQPPAP